MSVERIARVLVHLLFGLALLATAACLLAANLDLPTGAGSAPGPSLGAVYVGSLDDATVACLRAGGAAPVPGDGVEAVYGPVSLIRACGAVPAGWSAA